MNESFGHGYRENRIFRNGQMIKDLNISIGGYIFISPLGNNFFLHDVEKLKKNRTFSLIHLIEKLLILPEKMI